MKYAVALLPLALWGCKDMPRAHSTSDIEAIAEDAAADVSARAVNVIRSDLEALERKVADLESENAQLRALTTSLAEQVSSNARVSNNDAKLMDDRWDAYKKHTH